MVEAQPIPFCGRRVWTVTVPQPRSVCGPLRAAAWQVPPKVDMQIEEERHQHASFEHLPHIKYEAS